MTSLTIADLVAINSLPPCYEILVRTGETPDLARAVTGLTPLIAVQDGRACIAGTESVFGIPIRECAYFPTGIGALVEVSTSGFLDLIVHMDWRSGTLKLSKFPLMAANLMSDLLRDLDQRPW